MKNTQRLSLGALLLAVMLVLGYLESLIPLTGMPGVKPGLSNCVLMFSLGWLGGGMSFGLMAGKVLLSGLLFGSPFSMLYALAGGLCSLGFMMALRKIPGISFFGWGMAGGAAHNLAQVLLAMLILRTPSLISYLALLLPVGAVMGFVTGLIASRLQVHLRFPIQKNVLHSAANERTTQP